MRVYFRKAYFHLLSLCSNLHLKVSDRQQEQWLVNYAQYYSLSILKRQLERASL